MAKRNNWEKIKTEYVTTNITYRDLAKKYKVSFGDICFRGRTQGWVAQRREYRKQVVAKTLQKKSDEDAEREVKRLKEVGLLAGKALDVAMRAFEDEDQFNRYIVNEGTGIGAFSATEKIFTKVDTKALKDLTNVIKDLAGIIRNVYGIPTQAEAEAQRVAAERLALDKKKAAASDMEGKDIEVVFSGADVEDWSR